MTVLEGIQRSAEFLTKKSVESPRLQAELLLAHVLKLARMKLYLQFERVLSTPETEQLRELVKRRGQREPLQQIVGSTSFCGFEIAVNRHVLVPRPETELLAEAAWKYLNEQARGEAKAVARVLDFGTGSGCLAIALAGKCPAVSIAAIDISPDAIELAQRNAAANQVADRIQFLEADGLCFPASAPGTPAFDLIVSNPPYIPTEEIKTLTPEVRDFEPRGALDGGADGLDFFRRLAREAPAFIKPGGKLMVEFGDGQGPALKELFEQQKWIVEAVLEDYSGRQRILIARWTAY